MPDLLDSGQDVSHVPQRQKSATLRTQNKCLIRITVQPVKQKLFILVLMQHVAPQHAIIRLKHVTELILE